MAERGRQRKNPNGAGTRPLQRKDGRWQTGLTLPDGRRKTIYGRTEREAGRKLRAALNNRDQGMPVVDDRRPFSALLDAWLKTVAPTISARSLSIYKQAVRLHIGPGLGAVRLNMLSPQIIEQYYAARIADGASPTSVRGEHAVIRQALEKAVAWGLMVRNPASRVTPPRLVRHEARILTPDEVRSFVAAAQGDEHEAMWLLAITTGMRQGEMLGLRWQDVDLDAKVLTVAHNYRRDGTLGETKSHRVRRIELTASVVESLRRHRLREPISVWLFPSSVRADQPINRTSATKRLTRFLKRAGLPPVTPHALRHSCATALMSFGVPAKVVAEMLGHATVAITLDVYSHASQTMQRDAVESFERFLKYNELNTTRGANRRV